MTTAPVPKKIPAVSPIMVTLPDGTRVSLMHECKLALPQMPAAARFGHIFPSLASHSLLLVVTLCNAGCGVSFKDITCEILFIGRLFCPAVNVIGQDYGLYRSPRKPKLCLVLRMIQAPKAQRHNRQTMWDTMSHHTYSLHQVSKLT